MKLNKLTKTIYKLDVGCGRKPHKGYTTIDIEEYAHPDYLGDFRTMSFKEIEVIRSHHVLEHFTREDGINVLKLWKSWLKTGGTLLIETPDFEYICKDFDKNPYHMTRHAYGSQEAEWALHKDGWYEAKFVKILTELGFKIESFKHSHTHSYQLPNITVIATKL